MRGEEASHTVFGLVVNPLQIHDSRMGGRRGEGVFGGVWGHLIEKAVVGGGSCSFGEKGQEMLSFEKNQWERISPTARKGGEGVSRFERGARQRIALFRRKGTGPCAITKGEARNGTGGKEPAKN